MICGLGQNEIDSHLGDGAVSDAAQADCHRLELVRERSRGRRLFFPFASESLVRILASIETFKEVGGRSLRSTSVRKLEAPPAPRFPAVMNVSALANAHCTLGFR